MISGRHQAETRPLGFCSLELSFFFFFLRFKTTPFSQALVIITFHALVAVTRRLFWQGVDETQCPFPSKAFPFPPTRAALKPCPETRAGNQVGSYRTHHKPLDKARHPPGEVKWALMTILILVLLNSCWHWVKPQSVLQFGGAGDSFPWESLPVLPIKGIL